MHMIGIIIDIVGIIRNIYILNGIITILIGYRINIFCTFFNLVIGWYFYSQYDLIYCDLYFYVGMIINFVFIIMDNIIICIITNSFGTHVNIICILIGVKIQILNIIISIMA